MKKLLLSLAFATALSAPAFATDPSCCSVNSNIMVQTGINNGAIVNQLAAGDDLELDGDSLESLNASSALDLGSLTIQNVTEIGGDGYVQNINAEVAPDANVINGDIVADLSVDNSVNAGGDIVQGDKIEGDAIAGNVVEAEFAVIVDLQADGDINIDPTTVGALIP